MNWTPEYSRWRHGGWYVDNVRYPSGAVGCVSRNYPDGKWRIVCTEGDHAGMTYPNRDAAARAEKAIAEGEPRETVEAIVGRPVIRLHGKTVAVLCPRGHLVTSTENWAGGWLEAKIAFGATVTCSGDVAPERCGWTR